MKSLSRPKFAGLGPRTLYYAARAAWRRQAIIAALAPRVLEDLIAEANTPRRALLYVEILKYGNALNQQIARAMRLKLHRSTGLDILDIGTGFGHFAYVCAYLHHRPKALGAPAPLADAMTSFLGVPKIAHRIEAFSRLPDQGIKFDLIVSEQSAFEPGPMAGWGTAEWGFFVEDLLRNHLKPGGRLVIDLDRTRERRGDVSAFFAGLGARRCGDSVVLRNRDPASGPGRRYSTTGGASRPSIAARSNAAVR